MFKKVNNENNYRFAAHKWETNTIRRCTVRVVVGVASQTQMMEGGS